MKITSKKKNNIIYSLTVEDLQTIASQEINRELTDNEIEEIKDKIAEKINWYDAISNAINERIEL